QRLLDQGRADDWRPFGLGFRDGVLYVGGVDSAELATGSNAERRAALRAYVWTFDGSAFAGTPLIDHSLAYLRGAVLGDRRAVTEEETHWNAWRSEWDGIANWGGKSPEN